MKTLRIVLFFTFSSIIICRLNAQKLHLDIEGQNDHESAVIDSLGYRSTFSDYRTLEQEIHHTNDTLQRLGYIENRVISTTKINDSTYHTEFNLNRKLDTIYIYYSKTTIQKSELQAISKNVTPDYFSIPIAQTEQLLNYLNSIIVEKGLPFASLKLTGLKKKDDNNIRADLIIEENKKRTIDGIVIKGYEKFPRSFLRHFLKIKSKNDFNLSEIKEKAEGLNKLSFANQTRPPEVLFTKDSTTLYFYIEKTKSNSFDGFLGFGSNEETNSIEFDGYLNLNLINSLNFGESLQLNYKSDENDQKTFNLRSRLPYLFKSALGTDLNLNIFKKDSTFTTIDQSADLFYQLNSDQKIFLGVRSVQSNDLLDNSLQNIDDLKATFYNIKYEFIRPRFNSFLFPFNFKLNARIGVGQRTVNSIKEDQQIYGLEMLKIFDLNPKNSIYLRLLSEGIISDNLFDNELLRFGGINSIRGFEENILISSLNAVLNTEYRYQLNPTIYVHSIIDAGYLENDILQSREKLFGFGLGFGILTKAGLLKFNYANGKLEGQNFKLSNSKIHLSLNALF